MIHIENEEVKTHFVVAYNNLMLRRDEVIMSCYEAIDDCLLEEYRCGRNKQKMCKADCERKSDICILADFIFEAEARPDEIVEFDDNLWIATIDMVALMLEKSRFPDFG
jgi:hypothetical protein